MGDAQRVVPHRLPDDVLGWWDPATSTIHLDDRLTPVERRCVLAHEQIHAEREDRPCPLPWLDAKRESQVEAETARRLIPLERLARALRCCVDVHELADELHVTVDYVRIRLDRLTVGERDHLDLVLRGPAPASLVPGSCPDMQQGPVTGP